MSKDHLSISRKALIVWRTIVEGIRALGIEEKNKEIQEQAGILEKSIQRKIDEIQKKKSALSPKFS